MSHAFISTLYLKYTVRYMYSKERINCNIGTLLRIRTHYMWIRTHYIWIRIRIQVRIQHFQKSIPRLIECRILQKNVKLA
jgi:hypothetical protein